MKIDNINKELQQKIVDTINSAEDKAEGIYEAMNMLIESANAGLINEIVEQSARAEHDAEFRKSLGLVKLSNDEEKFYQKFSDIRQAITANQIDIIPTSIIDRTLDSVKKASDILSLVTFAPADVKKWIVAAKTGKGVWGSLTGAIQGELNATITGLNLEQHKLTVFMVIPKAIRELALPFVDRYFTAILAEAMQDGLVEAYINGDGKNAPIGLMRKVDAVESNGTASAKTVIQTVKKFSPKGLATVRKTLSNDGKRNVTELHLICNPLDEAEYVDPCLYGEALVGGYKDTSFMPIIKHVDANCPQGKAIFTIPGVYVMGATGLEIKEYDQTKALEDADLVIGKVYANGRAVDNNCAVVFNVANLEEYVLPVTQVTAQA